MKRPLLPVPSLCLVLLSACGAGQSASPTPRSANPTERACDAGNAAACVEIGGNYRQGSKGLAKDPTRAAAAYAKGCELKNGVACDALGVMYYGGEGVPKDERKGDAFEDRACALGHSPACMGLAYILASNANQLLSGQGDVAEAERGGLVEQSRTHARRYLKAACDQGNPCACLALQTGDCNRADQCSVSGSNGVCLVKCSEELGCDNGAFAVVGS